MPRIGLRIIKTTVAVFICLLIDLVFIMFAPNIESSLYSPFFAGLAVCYSISNDRNYSFKLAKTRSIGSIIGSVIAVLVVLLYETVLMPLFGIQSLIIVLLVKYILVAVCLIVLIYVTIITNQTVATFVSCLTYLSITVGNRTTLPPATFAFNRTISTIIGVIIALLINFVSFKRWRNKNVLFVAGVDNVIANDEKAISTFARYNLNELIHNECNIMISTIRSPASLINIFAGVSFKLPQIVMNGAAIYDIENNQFDGIVYIEQDIRQKLEDIFKNEDVHFFTHIILNDSLTIYFNEITNPGERVFFENRKNSFFKSYAKGLAPSDEGVVFYILVNTKEVLEKLAAKLVAQHLDQYLEITLYRFTELHDYYNMKIKSIKATRLQALDKIKKRISTDFIVAIGNNDFDLPILTKADYSICLSSASPAVKSVCDLIVNAKKSDAAVRTISRIYYHKNAVKYLAKMKQKQSNRRK